MTVAVRTLDDGAWVSVNDSRLVGTGDVWLLGTHDVCRCETAFFTPEMFPEVGVDGRRIEARVVGTCIGCGETATTDWLTVAETDGETVRQVDFEGLYARVPRPK